MKTAFNLLDYCRWTSKKKGFSDDSIVKEKCLVFVHQELSWMRSRLWIQMFTDEIWAMGDAHTTFYVTVKTDGSDQYLSENLQHKYSKKSVWIIHEAIIEDKKDWDIF